MAEVFEIEGLIALLLRFALIVVSLYAFIVSLTYSAEAYAAAGKWTKTGWSVVLGLAVVFAIVPMLPFFISIGFVIAALVFLADVRPALSGLRRR